MFCRQSESAGSERLTCDESDELVLVSRQYFEHVRGYVWVEDDQQCEFCVLRGESKENFGGSSGVECDRLTDFLAVVLSEQANQGLAHVGVPGGDATDLVTPWVAGELSEYPQARFVVVSRLLAVLRLCARSQRDQPSLLV